MEVISLTYIYTALINDALNRTNIRIDREYQLLLHDRRLHLSLHRLRYWPSMSSLQLCFTTYDLTEVSSPALSWWFDLYKCMRKNHSQTTSIINSIAPHHNDVAIISIRLNWFNDIRRRLYKQWWWSRTPRSSLPSITSIIRTIITLRGRYSDSRATFSREISTTCLSI